MIGRAIDGQRVSEKGNPNEQADLCPDRREAF